MISGDGSLSLDEINQILSSCMAESDLTFTDEQIKELSSVVFSSADVNKDGKIEFDEFKNELLKYPAIISNLSLRYGINYSFLADPQLHRNAVSQKM